MNNSLVDKAKRLHNFLFKGRYDHGMIIIGTNILIVVVFGIWVGEQITEWEGTPVEWRINMGIAKSEL